MYLVVVMMVVPLLLKGVAVGGFGGGGGAPVTLNGVVRPFLFYLPDMTLGLTSVGEPNHRPETSPLPLLRVVS